MTPSHSFVINMPTSTERYSLFCEELKNTSLVVERLDGIDGTPFLKAGDKPLTRGIIGYIKAACNAIETAKQRGYANFMVFDDDAQLADDFDVKLEAAMNELPEDWCILRLHPTTTGQPLSKEFSPNLKQVFGGNGSYGYVLNSNYYDAILKAMEDNYRLPSTVDIGYIKTYDVILQELMNTLPFFETKERLVYHRDGFSDRMGIDIKFGLGKPKLPPTGIMCADFPQRKIKIYYPMHVALHAQKLADTINELGYNCEAVREVKDGDDSLYILYCAFQINHLPKNFIVYQCEQWDSPWFNSHYWGIMLKAKAIWEFGENNLSKYPNELKSKVSFVPAGLVTGEKSVKNIDVLFYGALNKHRTDLINYVRSSRIHVVYKSEIYGEQMRAILSRAKVVLNIHYYESGHLEAFRINEALCCGAQVVSERNEQAFYPDKYNDFVSYGRTKGELVLQIKKALQTPMNKDLSCLDNKEYVKGALEKLSVENENHFSLTNS